MSPQGSIRMTSPFRICRLITKRGAPVVSILCRENKGVHFCLKSENTLVCQRCFWKNISVSVTRLKCILWLRCLLDVRGASHIPLSSSSLEAPPSITVVQALCKCAPFRDQDHALVPLGGLVAGWVYFGKDVCREYTLTNISSALLLPLNLWSCVSLSAVMQAFRLC